MHGWFWREAALLTLAALFAALALLWPVGAALAYTQEERQLMQAYQTGQIIRLHILANSDDPADQALKIQVRDAVIEAFGEQRKKRPGSLAFRARFRRKRAGCTCQRSNMKAYACRKAGTVGCALPWAKGRAATGGAYCFPGCVWRCQAMTQRVMRKNWSGRRAEFFSTGCAWRNKRIY